MQSFDLTPQDIKDVGKAMRDNSNVRELSVDGRKLGEKVGYRPIMVMDFSS